MEGHLSVCLSVYNYVCLSVCLSVFLSMIKIKQKCTRQKLSNEWKLAVPYCIYNLLFNAGRGLSSTSSSYVTKTSVSQFSLSYQTWESALIGTVPQEGGILVEPVDYHKDVTSQFKRLEKLILNFSSSLIAIHVYFL